MCDKDRTFVISCRTCERKLPKRGQTFIEDRILVIEEELAELEKEREATAYRLELLDEIINDRRATLAEYQTC